MNCGLSESGLAGAEPAVDNEAHQVVEGSKSVHLQDEEVVLNGGVGIHADVVDAEGAGARVLLGDLGGAKAAVEVSACGGHLWFKKSGRRKGREESERETRCELVGGVRLSASADNGGSSSGSYLGERPRFRRRIADDAAKFRGKAEFRSV